jgi:membrane-bound lytic murein transglycosylase B
MIVRRTGIFGNPGAYCQWRGMLALVVSVLSACAAPPPKNESTKPATFEDWKREFRVEALAAGVTATTVDAALAGIQPLPRVIELDRQQPESVLTFEQYLARIVTDRRVQTGRDRLAEHRELLERIERDFGVPPHIVVALWGIESDYGRLTGGFSVVEALATLAYEGRRAAFFRNELIEALRILDAGDVTLAAMRGSWAGAMGQPQFMPSTFRKYAVDYEGDGRRDIWQQPADIFASAAKYLATIGWVRGQPWGREVALPAAESLGAIGLDTQRPISEWARLGVRLPGGGALEQSDDLASIVQPGGAGGRAFLVGQNFRMILDWNRSSYFGVAAGLLADGIRGP